MGRGGVMEQTKQCKVCMATLPADKFKPDRRSVDNLASTCTPCLEERERHVETPAVYEALYLNHTKGEMYSDRTTGEETRIRVKGIIRRPTDKGRDIYKQFEDSVARMFSERFKIS